MTLVSGRRNTYWVAAVASTVGLVILAVCQSIRGLSYWSFSEGVYALTSRLFLQGHALYSDVVAAQPPPVFLFGAGILAVHDSLPVLRLVVGLWQVIGALFGGAIAWRLTRTPLAMVIGVVLGLLAPWSVHQHGFITPETLATPLILGGVLLAARKEMAPLVGMTLALVSLIKVPYCAFAIAIVIVAADRGRVARWTCGTFALLVLASIAMFGAQPLWRDLVVAQQQTGFRSSQALIGAGTQGLWNLLGLLICTALGWRWRKSVFVSDPRLARALIAACLGGVVVACTLVKFGTALNAWLPTEAVLAVTATVGVVMTWNGAKKAATSSATRLISIGTAVFAAIAALFVLSQGISVLASTPNRTYLFARPFRPAIRMQMSDASVKRAVILAKQCPSDVPIRGKASPFFAFITRRSVAANQPDSFLITHSSILMPTLKSLTAARRLSAARPACDPIKLEADASKQ